MRKLLIIMLGLILAMGSCKKDNELKPEIIEVATVHVSPKTLSLIEGESKQLSVSVLPEEAKEKTITWTSSNETIATVSEAGLVTTIKEGNVDITATSANGMKATCKLVISKKIIDVTEIKLDANTAELNEGETKQLAATVLPEDATNKNIVWSSSDQAIATVSQAGLVTTIKEGNVDITATSANGMKATCKFIVKRKPIEVSAIVLTQTELTTSIGCIEIISINVLPNNADNKNITWSSTNESIATVKTTEGKNEVEIHGLDEGECDIIATASNGIKGICKVTIERSEATDLKITPSSIKININESEQLTCSFIPEKAKDENIVWTSSDEQIASIDDKGLIIGVSEGKCIITCSTKDNRLSKEVDVEITNPFCELNRSYVSEDGLTVTINSLSIVKNESNVISYTFSYSLKNETSDKKIDEGTFKAYYRDKEAGEPQYGAFGSLFPGESISRTYKFKTMSSEPFNILEYGADLFFRKKPIKESLKWKLEYKN